MSSLTKRELTSWIRWSVLVFLIHTIAIGLINDWNIFYLYDKKFILISNTKDIDWGIYNTIHFPNWYPKVIDCLKLPIYSLAFIIARKKASRLKNYSMFGIGSGIVIGLILNFFCVGIIDKILLGTMIGFILGFIMATIAEKDSYSFEKDREGEVFLSFGIGLLFGLLTMFRVGILIEVLIALDIAVTLICLSLFYRLLKYIWYLGFWRNVFDWFMAEDVKD